jgi:K+ transporter
MPKPTGSGGDLQRGSNGIPLALTHHLRRNRVVRKRMLLISIVSSGAARIVPDEQVRFVPVGAGITRSCSSGFMEHPNPNVMDALKLAYRDPSLRNIDPEAVTYYFRLEVEICSHGSRMGGCRKAAMIRRFDAAREYSGHAGWNSAKHLSELNR